MIRKNIHGFLAAAVLPLMITARGNDDDDDLIGKGYRVPSLGLGRIGAQRHLEYPVKVAPPDLMIFGNFTRMKI